MSSFQLSSLFSNGFLFLLLCFYLWYFRSKKLCDGSTDPALKPTCGRPSGLGFNYQTGDLYIADAYHGLNVVGPRGGRATQLATAAEGVPFGFLNALDVDQNTGIVYFTVASARFQER